MTNQRDAVEALVNLLYLIEMHAYDREKVVCFVNQSAGPMQVLTDLFAEDSEEVDEAA